MFAGRGVGRSETTVAEPHSWSSTKRGTATEEVALIVSSCREIVPVTGTLSSRRAGRPVRNTSAFALSPSSSQRDPRGNQPGSGPRTATTVTIRSSSNRPIPDMT
jgi:hypothetical protein